MVDALFIDPKGPYPELLGPEHCWDETRDALTYDGPGPVIVHPPCGRWCGMAKMNERRWGAKVGDDGGCFEFALKTVFRTGGVLEHPALSLAWPAFDLEKPVKDKWLLALHKQFGYYWVAECWQSCYGHPCHKKTWLLYVGNSPPIDLDWRRDKSLATHQIGGGINTGERSKPRLKDSLTHITPVSFAKALISLADHSRVG